MSESLNHLLNRLDQMYGFIWEWMELLCVALKCAKVDSDWDLNYFCCREKNEVLINIVSKIKIEFIYFLFSCGMKEIIHLQLCSSVVGLNISTAVTMFIDIAQIIRRSIHQYTVLTCSLKWFGNLKGWSVFHEGKIFPKSCLGSSLSWKFTSC